MTNFEMVETLREKADVSYEEAKRALEENNWDLLDAMLALEKQGTTLKRSADFTTRVEPQAETEEDEPTRDSGFMNTLRRIGRWVVKLVNIGCTNSLVISRKDHEILALPVIVPVILLIPLFWAEIIAMVVGLFFGVHYSFRGPNLGRDVINNAMNKASEAAETVKNEFQHQKEKAEDAENTTEEDNEAQG